jgi:hypothetical protein
MKNIQQKINQSQPKKPIRATLAKGAKQLMLNPAYNQALYNQLNP